MNGSSLLNHSVSATIGVSSGSTSVPEELRYGYGIGDVVPIDLALDTCEKCHESKLCDDVPVSNDWYMLCSDCEVFIRNLVRKEVGR